MKCIFIIIIVAITISSSFQDNPHPALYDFSQFNDSFDISIVAKDEIVQPNEAVSKSEGNIDSGLFSDQTVPETKTEDPVEELNVLSKQTNESLSLEEIPAADSTSSDSRVNVVANEDIAQSDEATASSKSDIGSAAPSDQPALLTTVKDNEEEKHFLQINESSSLEEVPTVVAALNDPDLRVNDDVVVNSEIVLGDQASDVNETQQDYGQPGQDYQQPSQNVLHDSNRIHDREHIEEHVHNVLGEPDNSRVSDVENDGIEQSNDAIRNWVRDIGSKLPTQQFAPETKPEEYKEDQMLTQPGSVNESSPLEGTATVATDSSDSDLGLSDVANDEIAESNETIADSQMNFDSELSTDQPALEAGPEDMVEEEQVNVPLTHPAQVDEALPPEEVPTVVATMSDPDLSVNDVGMVNSEIILGDQAMDVNETSHHEIGDPLGEVYFGILKEYLCKIEVAFERTPRAAFITLIVGVLYIIFVSAVMILRKRSKESQLSVELSNLQSTIHNYSVERKTLTIHYDKLLSDERQKSQCLEEEMRRIEEKYASMDKIKSERKMFEQECIRLKAKLVEEQESCSKIKLEHKAVETENKKLKVQFKELIDEHQTLESVHVETKCSLETAQSEIQDLESKTELLSHEQENLLEQIESLNTNLNQVTEERDKLRAREEELECENEDLKTQLKRSTEELDTLNKSVQELDAIKSSEDPSKQIHDFQDLVQIRLKVNSLTEEKEILVQKMLDSEEKRKHLEEEAVSLREKSLNAEEAAIKAIDERNEAVKNLEVLTKYFKEREVEMQKELGAQQVRRMQKEEDATSLEKRLQDIEQENESYRSQCESMRKELAESERSFKTQLAILEKRAHESWVAARNFEREVTELKNVAAFLRQKLTETAKSSHSLDGTDGLNGPDHSSMFEFMPPPPPMPPGPLPPSMDFMMNSQRPSSSASGPWDLGPLPPPPPMPPLTMPFMPGMPPFNPHTSYSDYSNRLSPSSRQSHSPAFSYSADVANGDHSSLDYSSLNFSQSHQPQQQQPHHQQHEVHHQQHEHQQYYQQQHHRHQHDQSNC